MISVTRGTEQDVNDLESLYNDLNDYLAEGINFPGWLKDIYPTRQDAVEGVVENVLYVAKIDGEIVGTLVLKSSFPEAYKDGKWNVDANDDEVLVIYTFAVHPNHLNKGIGKRLIEFATEYGKKNNYKALRLDVYENNKPAISLYEKEGFKYTNTVDLGFAKYGLDWFKLFEKAL